MTDSVALLKRKNMIQDCEIFFIQDEAQTHVAQKVPVVTSFQEDSFLHYCSCDVLTSPGREGLPRRVSPTRSVAQRPLRPRAGSY